MKLDNSYVVQYTVPRQVIWQKGTGKLCIEQSNLKKQQLCILLSPYSYFCNICYFKHINMCQRHKQTSHKNTQILIIFLQGTWSWTHGPLTCHPKHHTCKLCFCSNWFWRYFMLLSAPDPRSCCPHKVFHIRRWAALITEAVWFWTTRAGLLLPKFFSPSNHLFHSRGDWISVWWLNRTTATAAKYTTHLVNPTDQLCSS